ncbi:Two-component sensor histidine kinase, contains HisKA and HATPase domains [Natronincola peptidivorans]|uniref:histidine kinase n=1 Tax=Natronincola peptidivorans TaxID=426128 RepID=A0A1I0EUL6_9FIRM|nr:histidine kinase N-terminal domain-containing protein [Natronincola peptidivorans]SET49119.1 Two-component sensor histidine kinase, contains HisKA and HATPase domains [Natronincola peptidivorans]
MLKELCYIHTNLSDMEIMKLESISSNLPIISDLVKADVFIDCLTRDPNVAIVVAEAKPLIYPSMYKHTVVGELALRKNEPAALRTLEIGMATRDLKAITQENKTVKQSVVPIKNDRGKTIACLIMEQDITEHVNQNKHMEILAETTEQLTETLLSFIDNENTIPYHINDAIVMFDPQGVATYANPVADELYKKLGYRDHIIGMNFDNLAFDGSVFEKVVEAQSFNITEIDIGKLSLQVKYAVVKQKKILASVIMLIKDITEVKEKEKELILKSVAIREIHHRVKNNLQTIASLLRLQSRRIDNDLVKKSFNESISRILSIAVTHEILAQKGVDNVDIKTILSRIKDNTLDYGIVPHKDIKIDLKGDSITLDSDKATSIALVVNELLQNSLEYAFEDKDAGHIEICIQKGSMYSSISIIDNGRGFDLLTVRQGSLGLKIVNSIVQDKLAGDIHIDSSPSGTKVIFDFKNE